MSFCNIVKENVNINQNPILLAIDTSTEVGSVCLFYQGHLLSKEWTGGEKHVESILTQVDELLLGNGLAIKDIEAITFSQGPGSFTGLRAGCGITQGLALAQQLPVIPIPTLLMLAQASSFDSVLTLLDARMGQVFVAHYEKTKNDQWTERLSPCLSDPDRLPDIVATADVMVGSGYDTYRENLATCSKHTLPRGVAGIMPHAKWLIPLALSKWRQGECITADEALPIYIRDKVALTTAERQRDG